MVLDRFGWFGFLLVVVGGFGWLHVLVTTVIPHISCRFVC